ncbi:hypothetical protein BO94DRAFT_381592 [Aspergillus sclerotioniger CBS 115572]|uniref:Chitin synthesis regulation, resistance to congo red-domain-containing protein n=1 Tax=Aspergillus sclerotioniger CBS 115572 TaxID=1450535 RepID=A0A317WZN1_9EURO|nr:hypothetical protein BO94DRAFT_381592 [Aspergillus sclerotioniger CBS 115572]PWY91844.1 hypothetical protein BO94DRAFT_381592 [Aspergillus sclerotioniger CBS 115572]
MGILLRRDCYDTVNGRVCDGSTWYDWGRWIAFGVIVAVALTIFFFFACYNARRRRRQGLRPHPGTGWLAGPPPTFQQSQQQAAQQNQRPYYADPYYQQQPPPQYSPHPHAYGYFGGQQTGIELQSPPNAYHGGERVYQAPPGPPPPTSKV